jgi:hypothetical protein
MPATDPFIARRMRSQRLSAPMAADPAAVVAWFGAVQAQDYAGAKWALTLRAPALTDAQLDQALADGTIIRPTDRGRRGTSSRGGQPGCWPRWPRSTCGRVMPGSSRSTLPDDPRQARFEKVPPEAGSRHAPSWGALAAKGIEASGVRLGIIVMWAELRAWICSGPRLGKQFTYAVRRARPRRLGADAGGCADGTGRALAPATDR